MRRILIWLRRHAHPKIVVPVVVGLGLLAYVVSLASAPHKSGQLWHAVEHVWWIALLLTLPYLAARLYVWHDLMREVGIEVSFRRLLLAFAGGEVTKSLPAGVYVENYLLKRLRHLNEEETVRSTSATTAMLGLEAALAVTVVLIAGIPGEPWVRWALAGVIALWLLILGALWLLVHKGRDYERDLPAWLRRVRTDTEKFLEAGGALIQPRTLWNLVPTGVYMFIYAIDLYFIVRVLPTRPLGWEQVIVVYAVMVLAVVLIPIPTEIGLTEISALGVLTAFGMQHQEAAVTALALRILATGSTIVVSGIIFLVLRGDLKLAAGDGAEGDQRAEEPAAAG